MSATPRAWPRGITYLYRPAHSKSLTPEQLTYLTQRDSTSAPICSARTPQHVQIRPITSPAHPANGQHGLFATRHLPPGTFILAYLGFVHGPGDTDESSDYDLALDRDAGIAVDAARMGNEARFVNDYRGVNDQGGPNAEFRDCWVDVGRGSCEKCLGIFVLGAGKSGKRAAGIAKGEEILVSYGRGFWREREAEMSAGG